MKRDEGFWNKFRGVRDDVVNMIAILNLSIESAKKTRYQYEKYIMNNLSEDSSYYCDFTLATMKYGKEKCLNRVYEQVDKCINDLYNYIDNQIEEHPEYRGKIDCLLDYEEHGYEWIYNEVMTGTVYERYRNYEYCDKIVLYYIKMAENILCKPLMSKLIKKYI